MLLPHPCALACSHPRHPLAAAARQRRSVGRYQSRAGVQAGARGGDGAACRRLAAGHGEAHQQREARPHGRKGHVELQKIYRGYTPPPPMHQPPKWPPSLRPPSVTCSRVGAAVLACAPGSWHGAASSAASVHASVACLARHATAPTRRPDRTAHTTLTALTSEHTPARFGRLKDDTTVLVVDVDLRSEASRQAATKRDSCCVVC